MKSFIKYSEQKLLESGLARIQTHLAAGRSLGIISAATGKDTTEDKANHKNMVKRLREFGYGPIQATGRSSWGPERSLIVPNITTDHLDQVGNEFNQQAVIHVQGNKKAHLRYLKAAGEKSGTQEEIGDTHYNKPNENGVTILKGIGFNPKDTRKPNRAFTFTGEECIIESLTIPRGGQLHPLETPYG
jgi:hypothetical protein